MIAVVLLVAGAGLWALFTRPTPRAVEAGFWFEPLTYESAALGGSITVQEFSTIETIARAEIASAFDGLRITISDRRTASYAVRVVPQLRDPRFRGHYEVAGASYGIPGVGGSGAVSFPFLAGGAIASAPPGAARSDIIAAIGRGIGRTAVHELTHQLLPRAPIHGQDIQSYEYDSAARREHYYGGMHWGAAWPLLRQQFGDDADRADRASGAR